MFSSFPPNSAHNWEGTWGPGSVIPFPIFFHKVRLRMMTSSHLPSSHPRVLADLRLSLMPSHCHPSTCSSVSQQILASSLCPGALLFIATSESLSVIVRSDSGRQRSSLVYEWETEGCHIGMHLSCLHTRRLRRRLHGCGSGFINTGLPEGSFSDYCVLARLFVLVLMPKQHLPSIRTFGCFVLHLYIYRNERNHPVLSVRAQPFSVRALGVRCQIGLQVLSRK